ncbi:hypothetical protein [Kosakonia sp. MUSA4]|uniref:hypothetical protein n=1 Tax=Kosakonia sp. MUSA4 TaxID=2067958 RepID=UPI001ABF9ED0|nr:hypothetical protein [Kosakonia sp. MUSA4]
MNTNTYEVDESTKMLADGYSLSLSDKAIPANGQRFKLTYQSGSVINCTVGKRVCLTPRITFSKSQA